VIMCLFIVQEINKREKKRKIKYKGLSVL